MKQEARKNVGIRENYIGQSLKTEDSWIFGQGKKNEASDPQQELLEIKRREAELLHASLNGGIKVGVQKKLTQFEMEELLKKGQIERDEKDNAPMAGLGKRKGGGGGGVGFEAVQSTVLEGTVVDVKREPELPKGSVLEKGSKKEKKKEKKKDKKKEKKKVTRKTKIIYVRSQKKKKIPPRIRRNKAKRVEVEAKVAKSEDMTRQSQAAAEEDPEAEVEEEDREVEVEEEGTIRLLRGEGDTILRKTEEEERKRNVATTHPKKRPHQRDVNDMIVNKALNFFFFFFFFFF